MATLFEVHCVHADPRYARQAAQAAFELVDRLELELSLFVPNSDISRINALRAGETTRVSPSTMECLEIAWRMHTATRQAFDVSIGTGLDRLELLPGDFAVHARAAGARLDLGGIGKGFAVDRMTDSLREWEIRQALIHAGYSSVVAANAPPDRAGWPLVLRSPADGAVLARVFARHQALSASGTRKRDHIKDPRTGGPVRGRAAWVAVSFREAGDTEAAVSGGAWGPEATRSPAALAETLSTAFMLLSLEEIEDLCRRCPGLLAWLVLLPTEEGRAEASLVHLAGPAAG
jgi:thiamine biosynthesis lipoprotein